MLIKNRKLMHLYYQCTKQAYIRPFFREVKKKTRKVREINKVFANDFSAYPLSKPDLASEFFHNDMKPLATLQFSAFSANNTVLLLHPYFSPSSAPKQTG